jgi:hypothetical protein
MWLIGDEVELLGVQATAPPLVATELRFEPGMSVLYGMNGAGKTSTLGAIASSLNGLSAARAKLLLHIRASLLAHGSDDHLVDTPMLRALAALLEGTANGPVANIDAETLRWDDTPTLGDIRALLLGQLLGSNATLDQLRDLWTGLGADSSSFSNREQTAFELVESGYLTLRPVGEQTPRWELWLSARSDEASTPALRRCLTELSAIIAEHAAITEHLDVGSDTFPDLSRLTPGTMERITETLRRIPMVDAPQPLLDLARSDRDAIRRLLAGHAWAPVPILWIGIHSLQVRARWLPRGIGMEVIDDTPTELDAITFSWERNKPRHWVLGSTTHPLTGEDIDLDEPEELVRSMPGDFESPRFVESVEQNIGDLAVRANRVVTGLLPDGPQLRCRLLDAADWFDGSPLRWEALDAPTGRWVHYSLLSSAQLRWVTVAIKIAMSDPESAVLVVDEPESALHPRAVRDLAMGLSELARDRVASVVVTTHSPEFLRLDGARNHHVSRNASGVTSITPLERVDAEALGSLGLDAPDLLQYYRAFLLVEGLHDEVVVDELLSDELTLRRVRTLPLRGAHQLSVADARVLIDFTDALIVILLDNTNGPRLCELWDEARRIADGGRPDEAHELLLARTKGGATNEEKRILECLIRSLDNGVWSRVSAFGLSLADIPQYLPVGAIVPQATSWPELRVDHAQQDKITDFKKWLTLKRHADFSEDALRRAAKMIGDSIPADFTDLLAHIDRQLARRGRPADDP